VHLWSGREAFWGRVLLDPLPLVESGTTANKLCHRHSLNALALDAPHRVGLLLNGLSQNLVFALQSSLFA